MNKETHNLLPQALQNLVRNVTDKSRQMVMGSDANGHFGSILSNNLIINNKDNATIFKNRIKEEMIDLTLSKNSDFITIINRT
ncbi:hypothetical protein TSAR_002512 [Trichomalopsis sarcophagae]|uniref:Uncharacterized protein n=1 Tax=Trichomalopsis sarcophagae TaxID=543379 RepID=A0A232F958_9HYME|nr:hypothetical protein TSAR_002512 [Trichomalopsis sarcophagae]